MTATNDDLLPQSMDDLRGRTPEDMRKMVDALDAHLKALHQNERGELRDLDDTEQAAFDLGMRMRSELMDRIEENDKIAAVFRKRPDAVQHVYANLRAGLDDPYADVLRLSPAQARDRALHALEGRDASDLSAPQQDQVEKMIRRDHVLARRVLVTENEHYRNAWMQLVTNPYAVAMLSDDERHAVRAWEEYRAMADWTTTAGGFGIPVFIDPSIILTAQESGNPFLQIAKQVTVNTNQWKGVSSAGVTWTFQTEGSTVSDASPVLAQPSVLIHMARGFIPYSIEVGMDYPSFASEMQGLLAAGYDELLVNKFTIGSGTNEPKGILTAISATSGDRVKVTTGGSIGAPDPYAVWKALPQKYRRNASWLMSVGVNNAIRQIATANVYHGFTVSLPAEWMESLFNKTVYESPYMPDTTTFTTTAEGQALVGDFQNFVIARNGGMSVELIPQLVSQTTAGSGPAVPTGQRGWFAYARIGSDCSNTAGFRLLVANT